MSGRAHAIHGLYFPCAVYMNLASDLGRPRVGTRQRVVLEHDHVHDVTTAAGSNLAALLLNPARGRIQASVPHSSDESCG